MNTQQHKYEAINKRLSIEIKDYANFQFKDELIALLNEPCIVGTSGTKLVTNSNYKRILHPLYTWITKTKTIHAEVLDKIQLGIITLNDNLVVTIYNICTNISIPKSLKNIIFGNILSTIPYEIKLQSPNSLYYGEVTLYSTYMKLCISEVITPNIELCKIIEGKLLKQLTKFKNTSDKMISNEIEFNASKLYELYEPLNINVLNFLLQYHCNKINQPYNSYNINDALHTTIMDELTIQASKFIWKMNTDKVDKLYNNLKSSIQYLATIK